MKCAKAKTTQLKSQRTARRFHNFVCTMHIYQGTAYKLVQHYAHTSTVKLYSDIFRWWPPPSGETTPQTKNTTLRKCLYCHAHITMFRVPSSTQSCLWHTSYHVRSKTTFYLLTYSMEQSPS